MRQLRLLLVAAICAFLATAIVAPTPAMAGGGCEGDVNGDGAVDVLDIIGVLQNWGECPGEGECTGDVNGDNVVDFMDLLVVIQNFGCGLTECETREDCDDGDPCTFDICIHGVCLNFPIECEK